MIVDQKFVYTGGKYREYRGYVFANGEPVTVRDGATAAALAKMGDFQRVFATKPVAETVAPVVTPSAQSSVMGAIRKTLRVRDRSL